MWASAQPGTASAPLLASPSQGATISAMSRSTRAIVACLSTAFVLACSNSDGEPSDSGVELEDGSQQASTDSGSPRGSDGGVAADASRDAGRGSSDSGSASDGALGTQDSAADASTTDASMPNRNDGSVGPDAATGQLPTLPAPVTPGDPGSADVALEVRTDRPLRLISELIYGTNDAPEPARTHQSVMRQGGNRWTAYNWENNASNAGSDYMFQNDAHLSNSNEPAEPVLALIRQATQNKAAALVTIPIVDYVAADKNGGGDVRNSGANYLSTRFKQNKSDKGSAAAATPVTTDAFVYQDEFVSFVKAHAVAGSRVLFSLDNEPDLWSETHAEVQPTKVTYAQLWERNQRFAKMVKRVWPEAPVTGFVSYGYSGYVNLQQASDANGRDFINWYLDQAKAAEQAEGKRLIDYLDLHWYPEARGSNVRIIDANNSAAVVTAREQAPRSLWDASYRETSWISDTIQGPINLLTRLKKQIDDHYPGTKLAFTEWNYGGGNHISGAIAAADVLGVFGREGVALATYWALAQDERFPYAGLRAFRNYDGAGAAFGDVSLSASTSDVASVTVYASLYSGAVNNVVLVAINKATTDKSAGLKLAHPATYTKLSVYRLAGSSPELVKQADQTSSATNAWKLTLPAQSVNVLVPQP